MHARQRTSASVAHGTVAEPVPLLTRAGPYLLPFEQVFPCIRRADAIGRMLGFSFSLSSSNHESACSLLPALVHHRKVGDRRFCRCGPCAPRRPGPRVAITSRSIREFKRSTRRRPPAVPSMKPHTYSFAPALFRSVLLRPAVSGAFAPRQPRFRQRRSLARPDTRTLRSG